jgi:hypothetical protein
MMKIPLKRRRGFALMLVIVQMTLLIALWGVAYRQLGATMRLIAAMPGNTPSTSNGYKPLALALALLQTGDPPANGQTYACSILTPNGPAYFLVTFLSSTDNPNPDQSQNERWTVSSQQVVQTGLTGWPTLPNSFGP